MKIKKITTRNNPIINYSLLPLSKEEKDFLINKFFKGAYKECYTRESEVELFKTKSKITLVCDSVIFSKLNIIRVVNNCGLDTGVCFKATTIVNDEVGTNYKTEYFNITE